MPSTGHLASHVLTCGGPLKLVTLTWILLVLFSITHFCIHLLFPLTVTLWKQQKSYNAQHSNLPRSRILFTNVAYTFTCKDCIRYRRFHFPEDARGNCTVKNLSTHALLVPIVGFFINVEPANSRVDIPADKSLHHFMTRRGVAFRCFVILISVLWVSCKARQKSALPSIKFW